MVHRGVRCNRHTVNVHRVDLCLTAHRLYQWIDCLFNDRFLKFVLTARFAGFDNTVDNIRTVANLTVTA